MIKRTIFPAFPLACAPRVLDRPEEALLPDLSPRFVSACAAKISELLTRFVKPAMPFAELEVDLLATFVNKVDRTRVGELNRVLLAGRFSSETLSLSLEDGVGLRRLRSFPLDERRIRAEQRNVE
jgi:hypothetical protein